MFYWDGLTWVIDVYVPDLPLILATHAHLDHIPINNRVSAESMPRGSSINSPVWATRLTRALFAARGASLPPGPDLIFGNDGISSLPQAPAMQLTGIESGHMEGAASLFVQKVEGGTSLFYAGEFYPVPRGILPGLAPMPATTLVIESTYGHPDWDHPPPGIAERQLRDAVVDFASRGPVIIAGYAGGKMTRVIEVLADLNLPFIVPPEFAREWAVLQDFDEWRTLTRRDPPLAIYTRSQLRGIKGNDVRCKAVYLTPPSGLTSAKSQEGLVDAPTILCGGRVLDPAYRSEHPASAYVPLRDHPTFAELLAFVKGCRPEDVWVLPGEDKALCWAIRHELGITCNPLVMPHASGLPNLPQFYLE